MKHLEKIKMEQEAVNLKEVDFILKEFGKRLKEYENRYWGSVLGMVNENETL